MELEIREQINQTIREVEFALIHRCFLEVGSESRASRLSAEDIEAAIDEYGGTVTFAPESYYNSEKIQPIYVCSSDPPKWVVDFDLWVNGHSSDLTVTLTVTTDDKGEFIALIDDIHIL
jgi:hypothetical protein